MHALSIHRPGQPPERAEITERIRVGGSCADEMQLPGCPASAMIFIPCAAGAVVEAIAPGVRIAGRPVPPGTRRLLQPGERAELHGSAIALEPAPSHEPTRVAAGQLLRDAATGLPPIAGAHLVVLSGPAAGARYPLGAHQTLGRGRTATIAIPDARASRVHARIQVGPGGVTVEDLGSKNGVRVNGVRIEHGPCRIRPGDELEIGETAVAVHGTKPARDHVRVTREARPVVRVHRMRRAPHLVAAALLALSAAALALAAG